MKAKKKRNKWHTFELIQDGMVVAKSSALDRESAEREIKHYAMIYSQDGPVKIRKKK